MKNPLFLSFVSAAFIEIFDTQNAMTCHDPNMCTGHVSLEFQQPCSADLKDQCESSKGPQYSRIRCSFRWSCRIWPRTQLIHTLYLYATSFPVPWVTHYPPCPDLQMFCYPNTNDVCFETHDIPLYNIKGVRKISFFFHTFLTFAVMLVGQTKLVSEIVNRSISHKNFYLNTNLFLTEITLFPNSPAVYCWI